MRRRLLALGLAMAMVVALSGLAVAADTCQVTIELRNMDDTPFEDLAWVRINEDPEVSTHAASPNNTVTVQLQRGDHIHVHAWADVGPYDAQTNFHVPDQSLFTVVLYMLYDAPDEGDTTRVFFQVTDAIGVTLHAHQHHVSIRTGQTEFDPVIFGARVHNAGGGETYEGIVTAFTMPLEEGDWAVVAATPVAGQITFDISTVDNPFVWGTFNHEGQAIPEFNEGNGFHQDFWLKGITSADTVANTMGNIYFQITLSGN